MSRAAALLLAILLCLTLVGCGEEPIVSTPEPTPEVSQSPAVQVGFALAYDPEAGLNPLSGDSEVNRLLTPLIYQGLYELDENFEPQPVLAGSAAVDESGLVWTIEVVDGVVFSDGTPLEASHVVNALNTARKAGPYAQRLRGISSVRGKENRVIITLSAPNRDLPALLDVPVVLEREGEEFPLGTGRYRYARGAAGLYLMANYNREGRLPYNTISLCPVTGADQRISAFDSGNASAVITDFTSPYALGYSCSYEGWDYPTTSLLFVGFNAQEDRVCAEPAVRQAFSRAFDRVAALAEAMSGHAEPTALPVWPGHHNWNRSWERQLSYDPAAAADLLAGAGYTKGEDGLLVRGRAVLSVTLLVNSENEAKCALADLLAEDLGSLGVAVTVTRLPWREYLSALEAGAFDLYLGEVRLTGDFDLTELLAGSLNYGGYEGEELLQALLDLRSGARGVNNLWALYAREVPFAALGFKNETLLVRWGTVSGVQPIYGDPFYNMEQWIPAMK